MNEINPDEIIEFLTFKLGNDVFALETSRVKEVLKFTGITQVPRMAEYLPGVINLRGNVISIIDISLILNMDGIKNKKTSWFVITEIDQSAESLTIGMMVDSVEDVIRIEASRISPPPEIGIKIDPEFSRGIGKLDDKYFIILDIENIVSVQNIETVQTKQDK